MNVYTHVHKQGYKQKKAYIIAEGPMVSTVRNFWKMITDRKCGVIVMCSDLIESGEVGSNTNVIAHTRLYIMHV